MLNNKKNTFYILIYFSKFKFIREMSVYLTKNALSCYLLNLTI